jgi:hypothetical protein
MPLTSVRYLTLPTGRVPGAADTGPNSSGGAEWLATGKGMAYGMLQDANAFNANA